MKAIGEAARKAGVVTRPVTFSPHLFRRTYATVLYKRGMGLKAIQRLTRHRNIEVLAEHRIDDRELPTGYFDAVLAG